MATLPAPKLDGISAILVDEKSIGKHHQYVTVVLNAHTGEVLHLAQGKKESSLRGFFAKLTDEQKASIQAVGIDRAGAYKAVIEEELAHADIVYDKFHLVANYNGVLDEVRRSEWRNAHDKDRTFIKGQRYNLFRNPENLYPVEYIHATIPWGEPEQASSLKQLLAMNENLNKAYVLSGGVVKSRTSYYTPQGCSQGTVDVQLCQVCGQLLGQVDWLGDGYGDGQPTEVCPGA